MSFYHFDRPTTFYPAAPGWRAHITGPYLGASGRQIKVVPIAGWLMMETSAGLIEIHPGICDGVNIHPLDRGMEVHIFGPGEEIPPDLPKPT